MIREASSNRDRRPVRLSVLMPCHNEERVVERSLTEVVTTLRNHCTDPFEVILVDDGSTDSTWEIANKVATAFLEVRTVKIPENGGKGNALRRAFALTEGRTVCFLDGDLGIHPRHVITFMRLLESHGVDVVIGSKRHPASSIDYPRERRALSKTYELLVRSLFGLNIRDTQAGVKMFRREVLESVFPMGLVKRYAFDVELLVLAHRFGYEIEEAPITMRFKDRFGSGVNLKAIGRMLLDTLGLFYRLHVTRYYDHQAT